MEITPQDSTTKRKHVHSAAMGYNEEAEDEYYLKKIQELVNEKMKLLAEQQVKEESKLKPPTEMKNSKPMVISKRRLEEFITNEMNGKDLKLLLKKTLYESDLSKNQNRLSMPMNQLEKNIEFLTENEKHDLENGKEFEVGLLGPRLGLHKKSMMMKMWRLKSTSSYVLKTNWNEFVEENKKDLKPHSEIQVWSFRKDNQLLFALLCV
ncbi:B3 domain-containing protein At3g25182 [Lactuca sativa]|uniref:B3 domain-containing protein At3g25182 n=1 Tax=Lactuca sativa TaxID=4236 RepID=UPI001C68AD59|nr:B3 domain-containing protein At3g25182 [Lactuca sativa]